MTLTDSFIRRPVLAMALSILIVLLGVQAYSQLAIRQYPAVEEGVITVTTTYPGAHAKLMQGFITTPLQQQIAGAEGIDYLTSNSTQGRSEVTVHLKLGYNADKALTEVLAKVAEIKNVLPKEANDPVIKKGTNRSAALLYLSFYSDRMANTQITDYLKRVVQPRLATVPGVASAEILGEKTFAMRIWLDPVRMAAHQVTADDVTHALRTANYLTTAGSTKGEQIATPVSADTDLKTVAAFQAIVITSTSANTVRLQDVADVQLAAQHEDTYVTFNGTPSVYIGISSTPSANPLDVISRIRAVFPEIQAQFPDALTGEIVYDATQFIRAAIREVVMTLLEASLIVILVVFLFLGSLRVVVIPVITIPLSIIGVLFLMYAVGYSLNLLTLLAMVLAIGLVVDDAIVVVENIHRHIEQGCKPLDAALRGAREIAVPVITMTITLAAVYAPIGFMGGLTGTLFKEFAFTLAGAVVVSGIVALTLSPMMCAKLLKPTHNTGAFTVWVDRQFTRLQNRYHRLLRYALDHRATVVLFAAVMLLAIPLLFLESQRELAPTEDQGVIFIAATAPSYANLAYTNRFTEPYQGFFQQFPEYSHAFMINGLGGANQSFAGMILKPWDQRQRGQIAIQETLQRRYLNTVPGLQTFSFNPQSLPGAGSDMPVQFVLTTTADYAVLYNVADALNQAAQASGLFLITANTLRFDTPESQLRIDRDKAAQLGITMAAVGKTLATLLANANVGHFTVQGRSYEVIPQVARDFRANASWLGQFYVKSTSGAMVPLSAITTVERTVQPNALSQFQQLNAATIQGVMKPGVSLGEALGFLEQKAQTLAPPGFSVHYEGVSRQYKEEGSALLYTFLFALIVIFLVLAAQFNSFRDPLVILISVPLSICGALIPLALGISTLNIYTQIGLVTLIGLISKHGILMVEFAHQLRTQQGLSRQAAIIEAASLRLRPILMTTGATVLGVLPLLVASGAGAVSRFDIGLVIATGMTVGTLFTLLVVPVMYTLLSSAGVTAVEVMSRGAVVRNYEV